MKKMIVVILCLLCVSARKSVVDEGFKKKGIILTKIFENEAIVGTKIFYKSNSSWSSSDFDLVKKSNSISSLTIDNSSNVRTVFNMGWIPKGGGDLVVLGLWNLDVSDTFQKLIPRKLESVTLVNTDNTDEDLKVFRGQSLRDVTLVNLKISGDGLKYPPLQSRSAFF